MSDVSSIHRGRMFSCVFRQVFWCHELDLDIKLFFGFWVRRGPMHTNQDLRLNSNFNQPRGFFVDVRISLMLCMTIWRSETCSFKTPASWCMFGVGKDILRLWLHASCSWGLVGWFKSWPKGTNSTTCRTAPWTQSAGHPSNCHTFLASGRTWGSGADVPYFGLQMVFEAANKTSVLKHVQPGWSFAFCTNSVSKPCMLNKRHGHIWEWLAI